MQKSITAAGGNFRLAAWDWRYYAEKVRKTKFDIDEALIKPYLQLENVIAAAFDVAHRLFGIVATERKDLASIIRTHAPSRSRTRPAATSACSSATTLPGPRSGRGLGCQVGATSSGSMARCAPWWSTS